MKFFPDLNPPASDHPTPSSATCRLPLPAFGRLRSVTVGCSRLRSVAVGCGRLQSVAVGRAFSGITPNPRPTLGSAGEGGHPPPEAVSVTHAIGSVDD